ncbi:MAG: nucleoside kinase [Oscillospiraceae bacterium]|nr:nucleoside kinase [Oscillospiraceae bacterium]
MRCINISQLNKSIQSDAMGFIRKSNDEYIAKVSAVAKSIAESGKPIVLLSGPSGSGKTTTALRLADELGRIGIKANVISMDNYFIPNKKIEEKNVPRDEDGNIDLESPYRVDIQMFQEHMKLMAECKTVQVPVFDFVTQDYTSFTPVTRQEKEVMIFEGIHALNPEVNGGVSDTATCIYVSVRTRLKTSNGDLLHPSHVRLMRRLLRDRLFRGRDYDDIFAMYKSVQRGENLYIMPHKSRADFNIDTFIDYEAPVYKSVIYEDLLNAEKSDYNDMRSMVLKYLEELEPIPTVFVPKNSLIKEFIG